MVVAKYNALGEAKAIDWPIWLQDLIPIRGRLGHEHFNSPLLFAWKNIILQERNTASDLYIM